MRSDNESRARLDSNFVMTRRQMSTDSPSLSHKPAEILFVEDTSSDVRLLMEAMKSGKMRYRLNIVGDGLQALAFLRREGKYANAVRPDLILLDLNLPREDGCEVLAEIKRDRNLKGIPLLVLLTSSAKQDVRKVFDLHAECYVNKPLDLKQYIPLVKLLETFWLTPMKSRAE
jgi:two-component system, chemotaxis family, response regulator Rcp1